MSKGIIVIISGPSGVGKGTVIQRLLNRHSDIRLSVSATTRQPRDGEEDGKDYYFLSETEFQAKIDQEAFVEWCDVHGKRYGTLKSEVERVVSAGEDILIEIDTQGARKVRPQYDNLISIFISPPSIDELRDRLNRRNTETDLDIARRLKEAHNEMAAVSEYDAVVVNRSVDQAVNEIEDLLIKCKSVKETK